MNKVPIKAGRWAVPKQQNQSIDLPKLADAQDGSEVLFAIARLLEQKHGPDYGYAALMRRNAHAIRDITELN